MRTAASGVALGLVLATTAACGGAKQQPAQIGDGATGGATDGSTTPAAAGTTTTTTTSTPATGATAAGTTFVSGAATPDAALGSFVTDIVKGDYVGACGYMGKAPKGSTPGAPSTQGTCAQVTSNATTLGLLTGLHKSFTPAGTAAAPTAVATGIKPTGTTATANDTQVKIGTKLLRDVIIANGKGIPAGRSTTSFQLTQINKLWYVTDFTIKT